MSQGSPETCGVKALYGKSTVTVLSEAADWMRQQGWQIVDVVYDESTMPPTPYYTLTKEITDE